MRLNKQQKRMKAMVQNLQKYVVTYHKQAGYLEYTDTIFIDDMLYGIGIALEPDLHSFANGYEIWKAKLREHIATDNKRLNQ